jgi:hypothetical protein
MTASGRRVLGVPASAAVPAPAGQLVVDGYPDGLKAFGGRVDFAHPAPKTNGFCDYGSELFGIFYRPVGRLWLGYGLSLSALRRSRSIFV